MNTDEVSDRRRVVRAAAAIVVAVGLVGAGVWTGQVLDNDPTNQERIDACVAAGGEPIVTSTKYKTSVYCTGGNR